MTSSHIAAGDTLLTLNDGNATTLDWNKLHVDDLDSLTSDQTSDRILTLMENSSNINFGTSYSDTGTRGRIHTDDYEADMTTDGNKVQKNKLTLTGGSATLNARGGMVENTAVLGTTGDAAKNIVAISGGTVANAYGADVRTRAGNATENTANITGGTVTNVYGAALTAANATGKIEKSKVNISSTANIAESVYGGHIAQATDMGNVTNSEV